MKQLFSIMIGFVLLLLYVGVARSQEGFENGKTPTDLLKTLKKDTDTTHGNLNITVYKSDYQEMVNELDKNTDVTMLNMVANKDLSKYTNQVQFNAASEFKKNLSEFKSVVNGMS